MRTNPYVERPDAAITRLTDATTAAMEVKRMGVRTGDVRSLLAYLTWLEAARAEWEETAFRHMRGDD